MTETIELGREIGEYRITGVIGRGGMATVYLAEDKSSGDEVALKVMSPSFAANESFRRDSCASSVTRRRSTIRTSRVSVTQVKTAASSTSRSTTSAART